MSRGDEARANLAGYIEQLGTPSTLEQAIAERDMWVESVAMFSRNEDYYRGLLDEIAAAIGPEAWKADDGTIVDDEPVRARVPDLVRAMLTFAASQPTGEMPGREAIARLIYERFPIRDENGAWSWERVNDLKIGHYDRARHCWKAADAILALLTPAPSATGEAGNGIDAVLLRAFRFIDGVAGDMNGSPPEKPVEDADTLAIDIAEACGVSFDEHWPEAVVAALREAARQSRQGNDGGRHEVA